MAPDTAPNEGPDAALRKADADAAGFPDRRVGSAVEACPDAVIVAIEVLDGDRAAGAPALQYVNLPRDEKWVDGTRVTSVDRLSRRPRFRVRFDRPGRHAFTVRLRPRSDNAVYSDSEARRNPAFGHTREERRYTTDPDGTRIVAGDLALAAAGGNAYTASATDERGRTVESHAIETRRLVWYVELRMAGMAGVGIDRGGVESELARHGIELVFLGAAEMPYLENVSPGETGDYLANVRAAFARSQGPSKAPYALAVAYTGHLASKHPDGVLVSSAVTVGPGAPPVEIAVRDSARGDAAAAVRYLWQGIVTGEGWLVSARFVPDGGGPGIGIDPSRCRAVPVSPERPHCSRLVRVDVTGLPAGVGEIRLVVHWVEGMKGGTSLPSGNLVQVCTRSWWRTKSVAEQTEVAIHELGHLFYMVPDGSGTIPDRTPYWYGADKGHGHYHCYYPLPHGQARYDSPADRRGSACVMYGETNGRTAFCPVCAPALRKQDLADGWRVP